jgi:putative FmdB family regulatory protein
MHETQGVLFDSEVLSGPVDKNTKGTIISHRLCYLSERRLTMPTYDFKCEKCKKKFSLSIPISEYEKTKFRCPKCKSTRVKQQITSFQINTSRKS